MTQLYTVRYRRKCVLTRIDGRKRTETIRWIEETHHDLPYQTAHMYLTTMAAENECRIELQAASADEIKHKSRARILDEEHSARPAKKSASTRPVEREITDEGYSALVNSMMEEV